MTSSILERYKLAQELSQGLMSTRHVRNESLYPHWIENSDSFWYKRDTAEGKEFRLVHPDAARNEPAFDHQGLAQVLTEATGQPADHRNLPIKHLVFETTPERIRFQAAGKHWRFDPVAKKLDEIPAALPESDLVSPDGRKAAFVRDYNLWIRDQASGEETALTEDGIEDFAYARANVFDADPTVQACWSPDSQRLLVVKLDVRNVRPRNSVHYTPSGGGMPVLNQVPLRFAYSGDEHADSYELIIIDADGGRQTEVDYTKLPFHGYGENQLGFFTAGLGWWSADNETAYFIDIPRGSKCHRVVRLNTRTGATAVVFEEASDTFVRLRQTILDAPLIISLPASDELIWFSERSGYGHLYLYDLATGTLKNAITSGEWLVRDLLHFDLERRELLIQTAGRDPEISPYYRDICKVNIDTAELTPLLTGDYEHIVYQPFNYTSDMMVAFAIESAGILGVAPSGRFIVTTRSRVDTVPESLLIDRHGKQILCLETADVSNLPEGWQWPEPVKLKAADGETDIYGVVYRPPGFSPENRYPVVDFGCASRSHSTLSQGAFINNPVNGIDYNMCTSMAALGFIVVNINGRGTPLRSKAFLDHHYGDDGFTNDFADRAAGIRQLGEKYAYLDLDHVGATGTEAVMNTPYALLEHSDCYKVAVVHGFCDRRFGIAQMDEAYDDTYDRSRRKTMRRAEDSVATFKGKLLFVQGMLDPLTPASTFRLADALQKANKDFDMLCIPDMYHTMTTYTIRRDWDYLVRHLQGIEPPLEFPLVSGIDVLHAERGADLVHAEEAFLRKFEDQDS